MSVLEFLSSNSLFIVLLVALVVWLGVFLYMMRIERKLKDLEAHRHR